MISTRDYHMFLMHKHRHFNFPPAKMVTVIIRIITHLFRCWECMHHQGFLHKIFRQGHNEVGVWGHAPSGNFVLRRLYESLLKTDHGLEKYYQCCMFNC